MRVAGRLQDSPVGSYAQLPLGDLDPGEGVTVHCFIWPTLPAKGCADCLGAQPRIWAVSNSCCPAAGFSC